MVKRSLYMLATIAMTAWAIAARADLAPGPLDPPRGAERSYLIVGVVVAVVIVVAGIVLLRRRR